MKSEVQILPHQFKDQRRPGTHEIGVLFPLQPELYGKSIFKDRPLLFVLNCFENISGACSQTVNRPVIEHIATLRHLNQVGDRRFFVFGQGFGGSGGSGIVICKQIVPEDRLCLQIPQSR